MVDLARLRAAYEKVRSELLAERTPDGHWVGELSSSALSTATAVSALAVVRTVVQSQGLPTTPLPLGEGGRRPGEGSPIAAEHLDSLISRGIAYLARQQNDDGGFGDTDLSHSNIATTYLVVAALHLAGVAGEHAELLARANAYIDSKGRLEGLRQRYGIDKTFVVPIMTNLALAGLLGWNQIDPLPFELACVPQSWYRFVGMPVVSYAIPALVAIGQARYFHAPPRNPITRLVRWLSITRSLKVLRRMQPDSGGYLEATPLTAFVVMSLASASQASGRRQPPGNVDRGGSVRSLADEVIRNGVKFLANSIRPDGSWPIDTNLATWNTTLAINALAGAGEDVAELVGMGTVGSALVGVPGPADRASTALLGTSPRAFPTATREQHPPNVLDWLLSCQHTQRHPFTGADPGGFGWSDLSGAVPDADDTPGALLALDRWADWVIRHGPDGAWEEQCRRCSQGLVWLLRLQNRDGGWPTFCRGWGKLPFDRSGADLTAHAIRGIQASLFLYQEWLVDLPPTNRSLRSMDRGVQFINRQQHPDGSWSPLWFGNQDHPEEDNPVYGTAKVLFAFRDLGLMDSPEARRGVAWLVANQNADGGWGSGVWEKARAKGWGLGLGGGRRQATPDGKPGVESGSGLVWQGDSVLSTQYSVLSTPEHAVAQSPIPNPQSQILHPKLQSSIEETALAVEALLAALPADGTPSPDSRNATACPNPEPPSLQPPASSLVSAAAARGLAWLLDRVEAGQHRQPAPIGFYFAKLWYYERLYPLTFTVAALGRACRQFARPPQPDSHPVATVLSTSGPSGTSAP